MEIVFFELKNRDKIYFKIECQNEFFLNFHRHLLLFAFSKAIAFYY